MVVDVRSIPNPRSGWELTKDQDGQVTLSIWTDYGVKINYAKLWLNMDTANKLISDLRLYLKEK